MTHQSQKPVQDHHLEPRTPSSPPVVLVLDDDLAGARAIARLLEIAGLAAEVFDSPEAFLDGALSGRAGCAVLDVHIPGMSGLELQTALAAAGCALPLVFMTADLGAQNAVAAMKGGAVDFLLKPLDWDELHAAVARALAISASAQAVRAAREAGAGRLAALSPREREVCERVARGMLNKQIAVELGISEQTVKAHRAHGMEKLGAASAAALGGLLERLGRDTG